MKHICLTNSGNWKSKIYKCTISTNGRVQSKRFKLDELDKAKKWVDLQLIRLGREQVYNTYKTKNNG